jgi:hypothetical protein
VIGVAKRLRDQRDRRLSQVFRLLLEGFDDDEAQFPRADSGQANGSLVLQRVGNSLDIPKAHTELQRILALARREELLPLEKKGNRRSGDPSDKQYRGGYQ